MARLNGLGIHTHRSMAVHSNATRSESAPAVRDGYVSPFDPRSSILPQFYSHVLGCFAEGLPNNAACGQTAQNKLPPTLRAGEGGEAISLCA